MHLCFRNPIVLAFITSYLCFYEAFCDIFNYFLQNGESIGTIDYPDLKTFFIEDKDSESNKDCNIFGDDNEGYFLEVLLGNPPQKINFLIDINNPYILLHTNKNVYRTSQSYTSTNENKEIVRKYGNKLWRGNVMSDIVKFPTLNLASSIRCNLVLVNQPNAIWGSSDYWQGILGFSYPEKGVNPEAHTFVKSLQSSGMESVQIVLELCGLVQPSETTQLCGYLGVYDSDISYDHKTVEDNLLLKAPTTKNWIFEVKVVGFTIGDYTIDLSRRDILNARFDVLSKNTKLPEKIFDQTIKAIINKTSIRMDDLFWFKNKENCEVDRINWNHLPSLGIKIFHTDSDYFTLQIPFNGYLQKRQRGSNYCYKITLEKSGGETVIGLSVLEGFKLGFSETDVSFGRSFCGPFRNISPLRDWNRMDNIRSLWRVRFVKYWQDILLYLLSVFTIVTICLIIYRCGAMPRFVVISRSPFKCPIYQ